MTHNQEGETIIRTLVQLGKALSIETLAEGIEQAHELSCCRASAATAARASCSRARSTQPTPRPSSAVGEHQGTRDSIAANYGMWKEKRPIVCPGAGPESASG